eukprot:TRINITY_DN56671_c0_g1_i1.p1 TRINITY_DN56671_c0_g1~~TRINITY_DN56671_c0_g1_i1.p1  ORF type:complete len:714 (+),score=86.31 TRINITY_DN56671_c0_g1_i1:179-2143(+)
MAEFDRKFADDMETRPRAVIEAWWAADSTGCSLFRWIPWKNHASTLQLICAPSVEHRFLSFPLVEIGQALQDRSGQADQDAHQEVLRAFLRTTIVRLADHAVDPRTAKPARTELLSAADNCVNILAACVDPQAHVEDVPEGVNHELWLAQQLGRGLVLSVLTLAHHAQSLEEQLAESFVVPLGHADTRIFARNLVRVLGCYAHRFPLCLDLGSLFQPMRFQNHSLPLSAKQLHVLGYENSFVRDIRQQTGASVTIKRHRKRIPGKAPVWSLLVSGSFEQLIAIERALDRVERTPFNIDYSGVRRVTEEGSLQLGGTFSPEAPVTLRPLPSCWLVNAVHQRRHEGAFDIRFCMSEVSSGLRGSGPEFKDALVESSSLASAFETVDVIVKLGTLYILNPPEKITGESPLRPLRLSELLSLITASQAKPAHVELRRKGEDKGKKGELKFLKFLRSGFNATRPDCPAWFSPTDEFISVNAVYKPTNERVAMKLSKCCTSLLEVHTNDRRLLVYTQRAIQPALSGPFRGDLRMNITGAVAIHEAEDFFQQLSKRLPLRMRSGAVLGSDWHRQLITDSSDYIITSIRVQRRQKKNIDADGPVYLKFVHVISLLPGDDGLCIEADTFEASAALELEPGQAKDLPDCCEYLEAAVSQLRAML